MLNPTYSASGKPTEHVSQLLTPVVIPITHPPKKFPTSSRPSWTYSKLWTLTRFVSCFPRRISPTKCWTLFWLEHSSLKQLVSHHQVRRHTLLPRFWLHWNPGSGRVWLFSVTMTLWIKCITTLMLLGMFRPERSFQLHLVRISSNLPIYLLSHNTRYQKHERQIHIWTIQFGFH